MTVILRGIFIVSIGQSLRCCSFFFFLLFFPSTRFIFRRSIDRSVVFVPSTRFGQGRKRCNVYRDNIPPSWCNRIATTSLSAVKPSPPPLRSTSACGATSFAQVAKEGRYSSFEDSLTRGVTGDSKREREREGERQREREREEKR